MKAIRSLALLAWFFVACRAPSPPAPEPPIPALPSGDELLAADRYRDAIAAYDRELGLATSVREQARVRFFRALARLADGGVESTRLAFAELRDVEHEHSGLVWGRIAAVVVQEMARAEALRQALMEAGADLRQIEVRVAELEQQLATESAASAELRGQLAALREERNRLRSELETAEAEAAQLRERVRALGEELQGLKQVDMRRQP